MEDLTTLSSDKHSPEHFQINMRQWDYYMMMQKLKNDALWCKSAKNLAICLIYEASINLWCDLTTLQYWHWQMVSPHEIGMFVYKNLHWRNVLSIIPQNLVDTFNCYWAYIGSQQLGVGLHVQFEVLTHGGKLNRSEVSGELSIFCLQWNGSTAAPRLTKSLNYLFKGVMQSNKKHFWWKTKTFSASLRFRFTLRSKWKYFLTCLLSCDRDTSITS